MEPFNFYNLLKNGPEEMSGSEWGRVLNAVTSRDGDTAQDSDAALDAAQNILFECSQEWLEKRIKIVQKAEGASSNPSRRSEYCLRSLQNLVNEAAREAMIHEEAPELSLVRRQVADHLRKLSAKRLLKSHRQRSKHGQDICNLWRLSGWGGDWRKREPQKELDRLKTELPLIRASGGGKGVFDYAEVLPTYIPLILETYGAPLSTAQICSIVVSRISPPLMRNFSVGEFIDEANNPSGDSQWAGLYRMPSPEDLLTEQQLHQLFVSGLSDREMKVFEMKEDGTPIDKIAEELGCSIRTVNNDWKSIFDKGRRALAG
jgi:hypothetical protein